MTDRISLADLAARLRAAEPRLGRTRLVCIDGPAGSGKTTLAARLLAELGAGTAVVHMDDLFGGWTMTGLASRLTEGLLDQLAEGRPGAYQRYDWDAAAFLPDPVPVPVVDVLIVEGCGSAPRRFDPWTTLRIWVEAPQELRLARGIERDGAALTDEWIRWQQLEADVFEAEDTRARADLRVDGTAGAPDGALTLLP